MKTRGYAVTSAKAPLVDFEFERRSLRPRDVALDIFYLSHFILFTLLSMTEKKRSVLNDDKFVTRCF